MKTEQQEGKNQPSSKQPPLLLSCPGCNAIVASGSKACKICGHRLHGAGDEKAAATKEAKKRKRADEEQDDHETKHGKSPGTANEASSSGDSRGSSSGSSSNDSEEDADSQAGSGPEGKQRQTVTDHATAQPGEKLDCPPFDCSKKGYTNPMVEIKAGLNTWHQVRVHKETANELRISYPGKYDRIKREWLKRTSSRFWRGPMAQRFWVCTDKNLGRWRPKAADETEKNRRSGKRKKISGQRPLKARREPVGHGETTEGTGTQTGASMGVYSGAEGRKESPKQASSEPVAQDRAEACSKPAKQQAAGAGSSEPPMHQQQQQQQQGPKQATPGPEDDPAQRGVEPAIHSNSGEELAGHRAGSMPGISSRDEVQAREADTPMAEAEQGAALAAWFKIHYAKLDDQGLLFTHLEGAGPEVGIHQRHLSSDGLAPRPRREYDVIKGRAVRGIPGDTTTEALKGGDWQPINLQKTGTGIVSNGASQDKSPSYRSAAARQRDDGMAQQPDQPKLGQVARLDVSQQRREIVARLQMQAGKQQQPAEHSAQSGGRQSPPGKSSPGKGQHAAPKQAGNQRGPDASSAPVQRGAGHEPKQAWPNGLSGPSPRPGPPLNPSSRTQQQHLPGNRKDASSLRHKQDGAAGKGAAGKAKQAGLAQLQGAPHCKEGPSQGGQREGGEAGAQRGGPKQPGKPKAGQGPSGAPRSAGGAHRQPLKDAAHGKGDSSAKASQERPPMLTLEPTDLFL